MNGNLRCCNNIHWENKDLCHCSMDVSWLHDIVPSKIKSNLNCCCQLTCDDWGIPNTKLKYCQCTAAALLCCKNTVIHLYMTDNDTWMMNLNSPIYSTLLPYKFLIWGLLLCIWDFGHSRDQNGSGGSVYTGSLRYHVVWLNSDRPTWEMKWKKKILTLDFHILHEHRRIGGKIFPWHCISIETAIIHEVGVDQFT